MKQWWQRHWKSALDTEHSTCLLQYVPPLCASLIMDPKVWSWTSSPAPGTRVESCEGAVNMESARAWLCYSTSPQLWYSRGSDRALRGSLVSQWWSSCTYNVSTQRSSGIGRDRMYEHCNGWRRREPYANNKIIEEEEPQIHKPQIHKTCRCQGRSPMRATYSIFSYPTSKKVMVMEHFSIDRVCLWVLACFGRFETHWAIASALILPMVISVASFVHSLRRWHQDLQACHPKWLGRRWAFQGQSPDSKKLRCPRRRRSH